MHSQVVALFPVKLISTASLFKEISRESLAVIASTYHVNEII